MFTPMINESKNLKKLNNNQNHILVTQQLLIENSKVNKSDHVDPSSYSKRILGKNSCKPR